MKAAPKFKKGDLVRIICDINTPSHRKIGEEFVVGEVRSSKYKDAIFPNDKIPDGHGFHDDQLELNEICRSPLWKALE